MPKLILLSKMESEDASLFQGFTAASWLEDDATVVLKDWTFEGSFKRRSFRVSLRPLPARSAKEEFSIRDLLFFPIQFADSNDVKTLQDRGTMFWECRHQRYVSYVTHQSDVFQSSVSDPL